MTKRRPAAVRILAFLPLAAVAFTVACVPPAEEPESTPTPAPQPQPQPSQAPLEVPTPSFDNWMDAPQTPGDWHYGPVSGGTSAFFGTTREQAPFELRCNLSARSVSLVRYGTVIGPVVMTIRTETRDRTIPAPPNGEARPGVAATLPARDPLLDAMAFSKGRFAVEIAGLPTLFIPAWPEVTRVIEDCR